MNVLGFASRVASLPVLGLVSRAANRRPAAAETAGYAASQALARKAVAEVAGLVAEGWTERQAADLLNTCLRDYGVRSFFHQAFVWYGERTRFDGVKTYFDYLPSARVLRPGEVFILDVAPIVDGYVCDIGYTAALGPNPALEATQQFLRQLRDDLPAMFSAGARGGAIWRDIDERITAAGYDNIHAKYPFSVLGHRVHRVKSEAALPALVNFGWQSYWEFLSRGLFGQLLNGNFAGDLTGLWAIEPHLGTTGPGAFGAKFEEILVVEGGEAHWLAAEAFIP